MGILKTLMHRHKLRNQIITYMFKTWLTIVIHKIPWGIPSYGLLSILLLCHHFEAQKDGGIMNVSMGWPVLSPLSKVILSPVLPPQNITQGQPLQWPQFLPKHLASQNRHFPLDRSLNLESQTRTPQSNSRVNLKDQWQEFTTCFHYFCIDSLWSSVLHLVILHVSPPILQQSWSP